MKLFKLLFSEDSDISIMRLMSMLSLLIAAYLALKGENESVGVFVYAAFGGKAVQRFIEEKSNKEPKE